MLRIALTGGIAAGKSVASRRFAQLGAHVVDHDVLARQAVAPGSAALSELVGRFGDKIFVGEELDRAALAKIVFSDSQALSDLNTIVHPYVFALAGAADRDAREAGVTVVVHDIPLFVESGSDAGAFELVATVAAPVAVRLHRLVESRGMTEEEAMARIEAQATDEERAAIADVVFDGTGPESHLHQQVDAFWEGHVPAPALRSISPQSS